MRILWHFAPLCPALPAPALRLDLILTTCALPCSLQSNPNDRVAAVLGRQCLSAYVISMATRASDVLAVELLQREARLMVRLCLGGQGSGWRMACWLCARV